MTVEPPPAAVKVLWLHQNFVTARQPGNSRPLHIIAAMLAQGDAVEVITAARGYLDDAPASTARVEREGALTLRRIGVDPGGSSLARRARAYVAFVGAALPALRATEGATVVYATCPQPLQVFLSMGFAAWRRVPLVLEVRDLWPSFLLDAGLVTSRPLGIALEWGEAWMYRFAERLIPVAPAFGDYLVRRGLDPSRVTVVPTGSDPDLAAGADASRAATRAACGLGGDDFIVLYAGSFQEAYGLGGLLDAARRLQTRAPRVRVVFAGNGRARPRVEAAARELGNVRYVGALAKDDLVALLGAADLGVVSLEAVALYDTVFPGKLFDYLAAGLRVLSTTDGQTGELLAACGGGVVVADRSPEALASAIEAEAARDPALRRAEARAAQRWVLRRMNAVAMGRRAARVTREASLAGEAPGWTRLVTTAALAAGDVLTRRSTRALAELRGPDRQSSIRESFSRWLERTPAEEAEAGALPALLTGRRRHTKLT